MSCKHSTYQAHYEVPGESRDAPYFSCEYDPPSSNGITIRQGNSLCDFKGKYEFNWQTGGEHFYSPIKTALKTSANPNLADKVLKMLALMNCECRFCKRKPISRIDASDLLDLYKERKTIFNCDCDINTKIVICPHCKKICVT